MVRNERVEVFESRSRFNLRLEFFAQPLYAYAGEVPTKILAQHGQNNPRLHRMAVLINVVANLRIVDHHHTLPVKTNQMSASRHPSLRQMCISRISASRIFHCLITEHSPCTLHELHLRLDFYFDGRVLPQFHTHDVLAVLTRMMTRPVHARA